MHEVVHKGSMKTRQTLSSHFFRLHGHFLHVWLLDHRLVLGPADGGQRKSLHLGRDVDGRTFPHGDGVALEELEDGDDRSD